MGTTAAALTSLSYIPQVQKAASPGATEDLSWKMLSALTLGLAIWVVYGVAKGDWVIASDKIGGGDHPIALGDAVNNPD
eukprot:gene39040-52744_t